MAKPPAHTHRVLDPQLRAEILGSASLLSPTAPPEGPSLVARLEWLQEELRRVVAQANEHIADSNVATMIAEHHARNLKKRGKPKISLDGHGDLVLEIGAEKPGSRPNSLPTLRELRARAKNLGVAVDHLGTKRRAIADLLAEVGSRKTALSASSPDPGPMGAAPDEVTISAPSPTPKEAEEASKPALPRRLRASFVRSSSESGESVATSKSSTSLEDAMGEAVDQDLGAILGLD